MESCNLQAHVLHVPCRDAMLLGRRLHGPLTLSIQAPERPDYCLIRRRKLVKQELRSLSGDVQHGVRWRRVHSGSQEFDAAWMPKSPEGLIFDLPDTLAGDSVNDTDLL